MTLNDNPHTPLGRDLTEPVVADPALQGAVWFLGALIQKRLTGADTADRLAVLEHTGDRGYNSPMHRHVGDDETFLVLDGTIQFTADGEVRAAGSGAAIFVPRQSVHGFVVASPEARFITLHTPAGFDRFVTEAGSPALADAGERSLHAPADIRMPDPAELTAIAANYGIEIVGPPPAIV
ncbi:cupin domain-containing protein [Curtobacterium sp. MCBD17_034]|uniref:cupin domain-containing protein n=1 Tax=unclassified Curtobacterium TaxID=257496 RepID=UPI000DA95511|nr:MULTISPECIES: cupin domain-containing protein [unclassified Curtobacterium]PZF62105.1 cupin domain-containing protein [Curtobacterium sp. MCBD17_034]PZM33960.1 cupin domain-containing protein [Curtobacterium sp. MCBD17_031]